MRRKKSPFLLLEILVALSLMTMLLSVLFSFLVQSLRVENKMEKARGLILERQNLQVRMQDILTSLRVTGKGAALYTQKFPKEERFSLVTLFDNGIDPEPPFSGAVIGRIYLDEKHNLVLSYWPIDSEEKERTWRKEILFSNVSEMQFFFLNPDEEKHFIYTDRPKVFWDRSWSKDKIAPPSMVRLMLKQNEKSFEFAFRLANSHPIPTYFSRSMET